MGNDFFWQVYEVVKLIPEGRVTSYGAIAAYLGLKSSARTVGWALNACPHDQFIPAHRVVNRNGMLTGKAKFGEPERMAQLLMNEGVEVKDDQVVHFEKHFWDPFKEL